MEIPKNYLYIMKNGQKSGEPAIMDHVPSEDFIEGAKWALSNYDRSARLVMEFDGDKESVIHNKYVYEDYNDPMIGDEFLDEPLCIPESTNEKGTDKISKLMGL